MYIDAMSGRIDPVAADLEGAEFDVYVVVQFVSTVTHPIKVDPVPGAP